MPDALYLYISLVPLKRLWGVLRGAVHCMIAWREPKTERELEDWFYSAFECEEGRAAAYYERPVLGRFGEGIKVRRFSYTTFAYMALSTPWAEGELVSTMYRDFLPLAYKGYKLVWRRLPRIESEVLSSYGPELLSREAWEDDVPPPGTAVQHAVNGTWHAWRVQRPVTRLRMRLCIENVDTTDLGSVTREGYPTPYTYGA